MALLIRGGNLITMTRQGSFKGDILVVDGVIRRVEPRISDEAGFNIQVLDGSGMTILPGMIDPCIRSGGAEDGWITQVSLAFGITTGLLLPDDSGLCDMLQCGCSRKSGIRFVDAAHLNDDQLADQLASCASATERPLIPVGSSLECRRVLNALPEEIERPILVGLSGCEELLSELHDAGVCAVIGVQRKADSPWRLAKALDDAGIPLALSCMYPAAKLSLLPVCAGLCVRDGMEPARALKAVTAGSAALLGLEDCGAIATGMRADLSVFDGDPLLLATALVMTIAGGRIVRPIRRMG